MDLSKIKKLVQQNGDKVIVVENDEPEIVVMSFAEYEKLTTPEQQTARSPRQEDLVRVESAGLRETEFIGLVPTTPRRAFLRPEEIRLEDLPL